MTANDLIAFEADIAAEFNAGKIRAPVHLSDGNESQLIEIFQHVRPQDWVCTNWRSHYHCLLKGVPPAELKAEIMAGRSISLCFPEHRIVSSAIVGGILPIAVGIAMGIKQLWSSEVVWCFMGDMTARTGIAHECSNYSIGHGLRINFVLERDGKSVCTDTRDAWGGTFGEINAAYAYHYKNKFPHAGAGVRVQF